MEPVQSSDALRLTGLTESQLREWCGRRGIFQPAVPARGPGRLALYSWQDIIALRILLEIFTTFGGKASGWAEGIKELRQQIDRQFFPNLWGKFAIFADRNSAMLSTASQISLPRAALIVPLDPHLVVLADLSAPGDVQGQLPLITTVGSLK